MTEGEKRDFYAALNANRVVVHTKIIELSKISDSFCKNSEYCFGNYKIQYFRHHPTNSIQVSISKNGIDLGNWNTGCDSTDDQEIIFEMFISVLKRCHENTDTIQILHQQNINQHKSK